MTVVASGFVSADFAYVEVNAPVGPASISGTISAVDGENAGGMNFELELGSRITGTEVVGPNGEPVEAAEIFAEDQDGHHYDVGGFSDELGDFALIQLPAGMYTIHVVGPRDTDLEDEFVEVEGVEVAAGSAKSLGLVVLGDTPIAPDQSELNDDNMGGIVAPSPVDAGSHVTVFVGMEYVGDDVDVWLFSTPAFLDTHTVSAVGTVTVTLPAGVAGHHRLAAGSPSDSPVAS